MYFKFTEAQPDHRIENSRSINDLTDLQRFPFDTLPQFFWF